MVSTGLFKVRRFAIWIILATFWLPTLFLFQACGDLGSWQPFTIASDALVGGHQPKQANFSMCPPGSTLVNGSCRPTTAFDISGTNTPPYASHFFKTIYTWPVPVPNPGEVIQYAGISGWIESNAFAMGPSETLVGVGFSPHNNCPASGSTTYDFSVLFDQYLNHDWVLLETVIVKSLNNGKETTHVTLDANFPLDRPIPVTGCFFMFLDSGGSVNQVMSMNASSHLQINYLSAPAPTTSPYVINMGDEMCFSARGPIFCTPYSSATSGQSFARSYQVPISGTLINLHGNVALGIVDSIPNYSWGAKNKYFIDPQCRYFPPTSEPYVEAVWDTTNPPTPGVWGPADYFQQSRPNAIPLMDINLQGTGSALHQANAQSFNYYVNAGDCLVHLVEANQDVPAGQPPRGVDAESQFVAVILPGPAPAPTCSQFEYSCGSCQPNGTQTCTVTSSLPAHCTGGSPTPIRACIYAPPVDYTPAGVIDSVSTSSINGWACAQHYPNSITVHLFAGGPNGTGVPIGPYNSNVASGPDVAAACSSTGTNYRFSIPLTDAIKTQYAGQKIYIYGINTLGSGAPNTLLINSGNFTMPPPPDYTPAGVIDSVSTSSINGWACDQHYPNSITVHLYAGGPNGTGTPIGSYNANVASGPDVAAACSSTGTNYRFSIPLTTAIRSRYAGQKIYVYGINLLGSGAPNTLLINSGNFTVP